MKCCVIVVLLFLASLTQPAFSQWHSDSTNTSVCAAADIQQFPQATSDGGNGAIIVWQDHRNGATWAIYAQHLDSNGNRQWGANGIPVCRKINSDHMNPQICVDGSGGAYVIWEDDRSTANGLDIYAQHISSSGSLSWDTSGVAVVATSGDQTAAAITADGYGNAFVAWEDNRTTIGSTSRPDIYMNKLTSSGVAWGSAGIAEITQGNKQKRPRLCDDGSGGCLLAWENLGSTPGSVWASRISASGSVLWGYQSQGVVVYRGSTYTNLSSYIDVKRDGSQFMMAWQVTNSNTTDGQDIYANRINMDSTLVWYGGAQVTGSYPGDQLLPQIFSDDSVGDFPNNNAGVLVVFQSNYVNNSIEMRRVLPDGTSLQPSADFFDVCSMPSGGQERPSAIKYGTGSCMVAWNDSRLGTGDSGVYAQRVDRVPQRYFPYPGTPSEAGKTLSSTTSYYSKQVVLVPRTNGAIAVWMDSRNGTNNPDIYAQLILADGTLPIDLTSFDLSSKLGRVDLTWTTAQEKNNAGFEVERRTVGSQTPQFQVVESYSTDPALRGHAQSTTSQNYFAVDYPGASGTYEYRIVDIDLSGMRTEHQPKQIEVNLAGASNCWSLTQSMPNPAIDRTTIAFSTPQSAYVDLIVTDILGRVVSQPLQHQLLAAGGHSIGVDAAQFSHGISSGTYLYRLIASDPATGAQLWSNNKAMTMQIIH